MFIYFVYVNCTSQNLCVCIVFCQRGQQRYHPKTVLELPPTPRGSRQQLLQTEAEVVRIPGSS